MSTAQALSQDQPSQLTGVAALKTAGRFWFVATALGQWTFVVYILSFYGGAVVHGNLARWGKFLTHGLIPGDHFGNVALATHLGAAAIITAAGPLQLIPQVRQRFPAFHRWTGRVYMLTAFMGATSALYLAWIRNADAKYTSIIQTTGISLDAVLILLCGAMALRYALQRRIAQHRRWAIRFFLAVSGVWFFRVGLFFWLFVNQGPVGFNPDTFQGPFLNFLVFAEWLLPLAVFQLYLRAQDNAGARARYATAAGLGVLTVAMAVGVFAAFMGIWLPNL